MKNLLLIPILLLCSCTHTVYETPTVKVSHLTFMANEDIDDLYFVKEPNSIHFQMGSRKLTPAEMVFQAFQMGIKIGGGE